MNIVLIQENPKNGLFKVYNSVDSGTHSCQVEERTVKFENSLNDVITMRFIDTPGLFDTKDDPNAFQPDSIKHFQNIEDTVSKPPFSSKYKYGSIEANIKSAFSFKN